MNRVYCLFLVPFLGSAPLCASQIVQNFSFSMNSGAFVVPVALNQFNPSLGTLTGITTVLDGTSTSSAGVSDTNRDGIVAFRSSSDEFLIDPLSNVIYGETLPTNTSTINVPVGGAQSFTLTAMQTSTTPYVSVSGNTFSAASGGGSFTNPIDATPFIGTGVYNLQFDAFDTSSCGGDTCSITNPSGSSRVSVTYIYTAATTTVPEPATFGILGLSFASLVWVKKGRWYRRAVASIL